MTTMNPRIELTWIGKDNSPRMIIRILRWWISCLRWGW